MASYCVIGRASNKRQHDDSAPLLIVISVVKFGSFGRTTKIEITYLRCNPLSSGIENVFFVSKVFGEKQIQRYTPDVYENPVKTTCLSYKFSLEKTSDSKTRVIYSTEVCRFCFGFLKRPVTENK